MYWTLSLAQETIICYHHQGFLAHRRGLLLVFLLKAHVSQMKLAHASNSSPTDFDFLPHSFQTLFYWCACALASSNVLPPRNAL